MTARVPVYFLFAALLVAPSFTSAVGCEMTTADAEFTSPALVDGAPTFYIDLNFCQPECHPNIDLWIYQESNGISGLQRDDKVVDDTCGGAAGAGDTIIF